MKTLKEIFRRRTSLWLALELILVTIICWWAFDPVLKSAYIDNLPFGYDVDRVVRMEVSSTLNATERQARNEEISAEEETLLKKVLDIEDVENASRALYTAPGFYENYNTFCRVQDSIWIRLPSIYFQRESPIFRTYGIQSLTPNVLTDELTHDCEEDKSIIISRSLAMAYFGITDVAGRNIPLFQLKGGDFDSTAYHIRAVIEDIHLYWGDRNHTSAFICSTQNPSKTNLPIIVRLRSGVSVEQFREKCEHELQQILTTEHCYIRKIESVREQQDFRYGRNTGRHMNRNKLIAAFFAINLAFGVFGTLLMYTRQRMEEAGVKRAFGATKWSVFRSFIFEAWVLTTISVLIGCIIYFHYLISGDSYVIGNYCNPVIHYWFDSIETHFPIVSLCVYLYILCIVLLGTVIPAWRICRSEITESLREE